MNNTFKFKAWHIAMQKMLTSKEWHHYGPQIILGELSSEDHCIMLCSNLFDKNRVEIYRGDIVKCYDHPTNIESGTYVVTFEGGAFRAGPLLLNEWGSAWIEVLGNEYENPDLLYEVKNNPYL